MDFKNQELTVWLERAKTLSRTELEAIESHLRSSALIIARDLHFLHYVLGLDEEHPDVVEVMADSRSVLTRIQALELEMSRRGWDETE